MFSVRGTWMPNLAVVSEIHCLVGHVPSCALRFSPTKQTRQVKNDIPFGTNDSDCAYPAINASSHLSNTGYPPALGRD